MKGAFPDIVGLCLVKLFCLNLADSNSYENVKIGSFIEDTHTSDAAASKISNLRVDQQELICWKSVKPEMFQLILPTLQICIFWGKAELLQNLLIFKDSGIPHGARCLQRLW